MTVAKTKLIKSRWPDEERLLFGESGINGLEIARGLHHSLKKNPRKYIFISQQEYLKRSEHGPMVCNQIYWREILYRAHFASVTSLSRSLAWISGLTSSVSQNQFLPFAASARSFIEAGADSWSTLRRVPGTISGTHKDHIADALNGKLDKLLINEELENHLIHYSHGRKLDKQEKEDRPRNHNAMAPWEYLKEFRSSGGSQSTVDFYQDLCQLVHPAMDSVFAFSKIEISTTSTSIQLPIDQDRILIKNMINAHKSDFSEILKVSIAPPISVLKALNAFSLTELHSPGIELVIV